MWLLYLQLATSLAVIAYGIWFITTVLSLLSVPPFIRTRRQVVGAAVDAIGPMTEGDVFYELGSGDGRVLAAAARANPKARCIGVEKYWIPYLLARLRQLRDRLPNLSYRRESFYATDLSDATHVYAYLYPDVMDALLPTFERQLRRGARVVSLDFPFSRREPDAVMPTGVAHGLGKTLYVYVF